MTTRLRAVGDDHHPEYDGVVNAVITGGLPEFEGQPVDFSRLKLTAASDLEGPEDEPMRIDDVVKLVVEGRVVRVDHVVDQASGKLKRVQHIKVVDAVQIPWDTEVFE